MTSSSVQSDRKIRKAEKQQLQVFLFFCPPLLRSRRFPRCWRRFSPKTQSLSHVRFHSTGVPIILSTHVYVHQNCSNSTRARSHARTHTGCGQNIMNTNTQLKKGLKVCESQKTSDHEKITNHKNNPERKIQFIKFHQSLSARICL